MAQSSLHADIWENCIWPEADHSQQEKQLLEVLQKTQGWSHKSEIPGPIKRAIKSIGGNSIFLSDLIRLNPGFFSDLIKYGPDHLCDQVFGHLSSLSPVLPRQLLSSSMRKAKQQTALLAAVADIGGLWALENITTTLTQLAEICLGLATDHFLYHLHHQKIINLPFPDQPSRHSGFTIIAMGKLAARELNFSSDIDLIVLYNGAYYPYHADVKRIFVRVAQDIARLMQDRDQHGYVFRTDFRLRPAPTSTPIAVSVDAALQYYESSGQTWERAALSKARIVAGDQYCGAKFLAAIRPFIWRRNLDFSVLDEIRDIKIQIDQYKTRRKKDLLKGALSPITIEDKRDWLLGYNIKLSYGGIREIEFLCQSLQLVWGGRNPDLRCPTTLGALTALAKAGIINSNVTNRLAECYRYLRRLEHRLQMQNDRQTHSLPATSDKFAVFAKFAGFKNDAELVNFLIPLLQDVRYNFVELFCITTDKPDDSILSPDSPDLDSFLRQLNLPVTEALATLRSWSTPRLRALHSIKARSILLRILPKLLNSMAKQRDPITALRRFDTVLERHRAGVQLLSLFERNPALMIRVTHVLGISPFLADLMASVPAALDALLEDNDNFLRPHIRHSINEIKKNSFTIEETISSLRHFLRQEEFHLSAARMEGRISTRQAGLIRTNMADQIIRLIFSRILTEHIRRYGRIPKSGVAIVVLGKTGSKNMMTGSDLDLMIIFDYPIEYFKNFSHAPRGGRSIPTGTYFSCLAQSFITAITAADANGPLYHIDMRLRPSGSKGPVAVPLSSFQRYHQETAWTWEGMSLTRARVVAGHRPFVPLVKQAISDALDQATHRHNVLSDARDMRLRLSHEHPKNNPWDIKYRAGGLMELEFIIQALQLSFVNHTLRHVNTNIAISRLRQGGVLSQTQASSLVYAERFWSSLQCSLRIIYGTYIPDETQEEMSLIVHECLLRGLTKDLRTPWQETTPNQLKSKMDLIALTVRNLFNELVAALDD